MDLEMLLALATFAFASSITPGPNNLMIMASGANFGVRGSLPHLLGISGGFMVMLVLVGCGLGVAIEASPRVALGLRICALGFVLWLAWRLATSTSVGDRVADALPLTFVQAALFQWVNPKAWAMALTAVSVYSPDSGLVAAALVALVFGAVNLPSVSVWMVLGVRLRSWLASPGRVRGFNVTMAVLLLASVAPLVLAS